jgi:AraC family transcriptional regulator
MGEKEGGPAKVNRQSGKDSADTCGFPPPLLSSRLRDWRDIEVELHHFRCIDVVVPAHDHLIGVHLAGSVSLLQSRGGRTRVRYVRPGDITITPRGDPKRFQHTGENVVIVIRLSGAFVETVAGDERTIDPRRFEIEENFGTPDAKLVGLGRQVLGVLELGDLAGRLKIDALKVDLATHLLGHYSIASRLLRKPATALSPRKLRRAVDYIDANLREDITLADLAQALSMSPSHFAHAFRQATGSSPHRFVIDRRVERAKSLLLATDLPITEIAHRIGCASHSHFSMLFHRATGQTPRDFRS